MKIEQKLIEFKKRWLNYILRTFLRIWSIVTLISSFILFFTLVYRYGFMVGERVLREIHDIYHTIWIIYLIMITAQIFISSKSRQEHYERYRRFIWGLYLVFYLSMIAGLFHPSTNVMHESVGLSLWMMVGSEGFRLIFMVIFAFMNMSIWISKSFGRHTNPSLILAVSFILIILMGTGLLMLPRSTIHGISWVNALFVSTSAVCVTGLTPLDLSVTFTPVGMTVILILIQIGGLGLMTFTSFFALFFMGNTSLYNQIIVKDMISSNSLNSLLSTLGNILLFTLVLESIGSILIWFNIHDTLGMSLNEEIGTSIFHSISAFCNAGFSTLPDNLGYAPLMHGHNMFYIYISFLVILGGIGFPILQNFKDIFFYYMRRLYNMMVHNRKRELYLQMYNLNTKIVIFVSCILLLVGTLAFMFFEWNHAFAGMSLADKLTHAFFNAVCPRTAGFSSVTLTSFTVPSILIYMVLMWIGGCAQSTAGGIKVNTFAVAYLNIIAVLRGSDRVEVYGRELSVNSIRRANATIVISLMVIFCSVFIIAYSDPEISLYHVVFECVSAFGTVGSSLGATSLLSSTSKIVLCVVMLVGRVGFITLMLGILKQRPKLAYRYPHEDIIIN